MARKDISGEWKYKRYSRGCCGTPVFVDGEELKITDSGTQAQIDCVNGPITVFEKSPTLLESSPIAPFPGQNARRVRVNITLANNKKGFKLAIRVACSGEELCDPDEGGDGNPKA